MKPNQPKSRTNAQPKRNPPPQPTSPPQQPGISPLLDAPPPPCSSDGANTRPDPDVQPLQADADAESREGECAGTSRQTRTPRVRAPVPRAKPAGPLNATD